MDKIINFHPNVAPSAFNVICSYVPTAQLIAWGDDGIHTYQMALLNSAWDAGYTIRIWYRTDKESTFDEFYDGGYVHNTQLRKEHNIQKLWAAGVLGKHLVTGYKPGGA